MKGNLRAGTVVFFLLSIALGALDANAEFRFVPTRPTPFAVKGAETYLLESFYRTELYFGRSRPDGGVVTDGEWNRFLAEVVTPRFPDGFTILNGTGQYREKSGKIIREPSEVLVFLYTRKTREASRRKIDEIRRAYVKQFSQESVLRMDILQAVRVFF